MGTKQESLLLSVKNGVLSWLESIGFVEPGKTVCRWKYCSAMERPYGLIPSAHAVIIMGMLDELQAISEEQKNEISAYLHSEQDSTDGFFKDSLVSESDLVPNHAHSMKDIWGQMTGASVQALKLLGEKPDYQLPKSFYISDECVDIVKDMKNWNWSNPWHVGERFLRSLQALADGDNREVIDNAFHFYESEVLDTSNGMPMKYGCSQPFVAAAGLFKILKAYKYFSRPYPAAEKAVDFVLALQDESGEFADDMCLNWDCIWVLRELDRMLNQQYRHDSIVKASLKLSKFLLKKYCKNDGGFSFFQESSIQVHHSVHIGGGKAVSDTMGTTMVLRCLFYSDEFTGAIDKTAYLRIEPATIL